MSKPDKRKLYSLVINALTEGDSFIVPSGYNWVKNPYIGGFVALETIKRSYFRLETYNRYEIGNYEIYKYKGTISVSDKGSCNS